MKSSRKYKLEMKVRGEIDLKTVYLALKPDNLGMDIAMDIDDDILTICLESDKIESIKGAVNDIFRAIQAIKDLV